MVRHQELEPRTIGLTIQWKPFIYEDFTFHVYQDVAGEWTFMILDVLSNNNAWTSLFDIFIGLLCYIKRSLNFLP